jgi:transcriptional regulator with PAS, ATPase and Fis domain
MEVFDWAKEFPGSVTICDLQGTILYMNDKSCEVFQENGGEALIGQNLFTCHSDASNHKINRIMQTAQPNIYTIEKKGIKKLIYQSPWYHDGQMAGLVELSLEIPFEMPHFLRS